MFTFYNKCSLLMRMQWVHFGQVNNISTTRDLGIWMKVIRLCPSLYLDRLGFLYFLMSRALFMFCVMLRRSSLCPSLYKNSR